MVLSCIDKVQNTYYDQISQGRNHQLLPEAYLKYEDFSNHYCTVIMPAGVKKPKQKASVEGTVGKIATAIIARLRNNEYASIHDLKADVAAALEDFNNKPFQKREGSRREVFEANERITLLLLPAFP